MQILCQEIFKELKSIEKIQDHKMIDIWLLTLIYMNSELLQKSVLKLLRKKIIEGCIEEAMFYHCIHGNKDLALVYCPDLFFPLLFLYKNLSKEALASLNECELHDLIKRDWLEGS